MSMDHPLPGTATRPEGPCHRRSGMAAISTRYLDPDDLRPARSLS